MGEVGNVYITIGAHLVEATKALEQIKQELKGVEGSTKSADDKLKKFADTCKATGQQFKDFGKPLMLAGAAITGAFAIAIKKTADLGDKFYDLAQRTGIAVETLSSFKLAADKSGSSVEGFALGMKGLSRVMYEAASGGKEAKEAFVAVGVSATDDAGKLRPLEEVMIDVADRFAGMADGAEKNALAMKLFGKSGMDLIPMLNLGRKGLEENIAQMQKYGVVTREEAEAGDAFNDAMTELGAATGGLSRAISGLLLPALTKLATGAADVVAKVSAWAREHKGLTTVLAGGTFAIGAVATALGTLAYGIGTVISQLPKLIAGFKALTSYKSLVFTVSIVGAALVIAEGQRIADKFAQFRKEGQSPWQAFTTAISPFREAELKLIALRDATIDLAGAGILLSDAFRAVKGAFDAAVTPAAKLTSVFKDFGLKTKTELTAELAAAEAALVTLKGSVEATPGQLKILEDKIASLKEAMSGVKAETKSLAEQFGLLARVDLEKKYQDMLTALTAYRGKLTEGGEQKLITDLIALRAELDGTVPSIVTMDGVLKGVDDTIAGLFTEGEISDWGASWSGFTDTMQADFLEATNGIQTDVLGMAPSAELMELKFKTIGDAMGVSADTIRVACWNIQAQFLSTMGIIIPMIESLPTVSAPATKTMGEMFAGLFNDIATGFGDTVKTWLEGATTFGDFLKGLWGNVKDAFFTMIGQMVTQWIVGLITPLVTTSAAAGATMAGSLGAGLSSLGGAIAGVVKALIGILPAMATAIATAATTLAAAAPAIITVGLIALGLFAAIKILGAIFASAKSGAADGMGRVVERQDQQTAIQGSIIEFMRNDIRWGMQTSIKVLENIAYTQFKTTHDWLRKINESLGNMKSAASGAVVTRPQMVMTHGTPARPEYILPEPDLKALMVEGPRVAAAVPTRRESAPIYIRPIVINKRDHYLIEFVQENLDHLGLTVPTSAVRG